MAEPDGRRRSASRAFRAELRRELSGWRGEGLVDERAERELTARYALDEQGVDVASAAVYALGALLVGGGVISFVAWNWDRVPDALKLTLGAAVMAAAHLGGWHLWKIRGTWPRCGQALVLLGTLLFGANIGLVAQIWHISANWYGGFGAWALGAAVAAWAAGCAVNGVLGVALAFLWSCGHVADNSDGWPFVPPLLVAVFLPPALRLRSRWLFAATAVTAVASLGVAAGEETGEPAAVFSALLAGAAALVAWPLGFEEGTRGAHLAPVARVLGFLLFGGLAYVFSFRDTADDLTFHEIEEGTFRYSAAAIPTFLCAAAFVVLGGLRTADVAAASRGRSPTLAALVGRVLLLVAMTTPEDGVWPAVAGNAALALTAAVGIAASVRDLSRGPFWWGTLTLALLVVSRFFEYDTNLGVKALVFAASGVGVILFGILFEKRLRARRSHDAA